MLRDAPRLGRCRRAPMSGQIERVCAIRVRKGIGEGAQVLDAASPAVEEEKGRSVGRPLSFDVQVLVGHGCAQSASRTTAKRSAGNHLHTSAFLPMIEGPFFWLGARLFPRR